MADLHIEPLPRNATAGEVLRFVAGLGKIDGKRIGKILRLGNAARVEVPDTHASLLVAALDGATFRERRVRVRYAARPTGDGSAHFVRLARLLDLEAEAERAQLKARAASGIADDGTSLTKLVIVEEDAGLGGRLILTFAAVGRTPLPPNRLGPGAPVVVTELSVRRPTSFRGVVSDRGERTIAVAFEQSDAEWPDDATWRLDLSPDEASRLRQQAALARVGAAEGDRLAELRAVLMGEREPCFLPSPLAGEGPGVRGLAVSEGKELPLEGNADPSPPTPLPQGERGAGQLNPPQLAAIEFALSAQDVAVIHGPPGTGKTTTVVELIRQAVRRGERVLACAPSNAAVDNMLDKLLAIGEEPVRIGHPARVAAQLRDRALDMLVQSHPDARQARKFTREAHALFRKADKWTKAKPQPGEKQALRSEAKDLLSEARKLEQLAVERVLDAAPIVCATLTGVDSEILGQRRFHLAVLDEACQSTEPASWVPLLRADRVVFAGDPCQLPPTILSPDAADQGLAVSLMERVMATLGPNVSRLLTVQYRMHAAIMGFSSAEFYSGELVADDSVVSHRLADLPDVRAEPLTETPVKFIDTAGASYDEELEEDSGSRRNPQEAALVAKVVRQLLDAGVAAKDVAVIAPYSAQVRLVRELLAGRGVEIDSVDGFQGREKEAVVISFVRSNPEGEIGFLADVRRTNVALTRARRKLVVIGDSATLANHEFYARMIGYFETIGAYSSIWEEDT